MCDIYIPEFEKRLNLYQPPEQVMDALGVRLGMKVGEVGAGHGRYIVHMGRRVGESGKIYANDIDEEALEYLRNRCQREGIINVVTILGTLTDPRLPARELDIVYIIGTYHHLEKPVELMNGIASSLKQQGRLVIIERTPIKCPWMDSHSVTPKEVLLEEANQAGFKLKKLLTFLPRDDIYIFARYAKDHSVVG